MFVKPAKINALDTAKLHTWSNSNDFKTLTHWINIKISTTLTHIFKYKFSTFLHSTYTHFLTIHFSCLHTLYKCLKVLTLYCFNDFLHTFLHIHTRPHTCIVSIQTFKSLVYHKEKEKQFIVLIAIMMQERKKERKENWICLTLQILSNSISVHFLHRILTVFYLVSSKMEL